MKKTRAIALFALIAIAALSFAAIVEARPFMNWRMIPNQNRNPDNSNRPTQQSYAYLNGVVTDWGSTIVKGMIQAQTRTIVQNDVSRQASSATVIWTTNLSRPINALRSATNFTYTFYTAKLINASISALNFGTNDFFMNGTWTVYKITTTFTVITNITGHITKVNHNQDAIALATNTYGELSVNDNWTTFTLAINNVNSLTGTINAQRITTRMFNPFKICNDNTNTITPAEITTLAHSYGAMPGWENYDHIMDYNFNYKIDITDLATAAANMNQ